MPDVPDDILARLVTAIERLEQGAAEGLDPASAARFIGVSVAKLHDLNSRGLMPAPAEIGDGGRCPRWSRTELKVWLLAGCPSRIRWQSIRHSELRKVG